MILNTTSLTPLYKQIEEQIERQILDGTLKVSESLPSIRGFAKELEVSVITIKKAYEALEKKNLILAKAGKGFFVGGENSKIIDETMNKKLEENLLNASKMAKTLNLGERDLIEKLLKFYREV